MESLLIGKCYQSTGRCFLAPVLTTLISERLSNIDNNGNIMCTFSKWFDGGAKEFIYLVILGSHVETLMGLMS